MRPCSPPCSAMLLDHEALAGIAAGRISLAFRWWRRPTVKPGGRLHSQAVVLAIGAVDEIDPLALTEADARAAGFADLPALIAALPRREGCRLYRIALGLAG